MATPKGFGSSPSPKQPTQGAVQRKVAAHQYDELKKQGFPEFNIFVRLPEKPDSWLPVGSLAVKRSSAINQAIFENQAELRKGAVRLFPRLGKRVGELEYGYRLKDKAYQDEPIQVAIPPQPGILQRWRDQAATFLQQITALGQRK